MKYEANTAANTKHQIKINMSEPSGHKRVKLSAVDPVAAKAARQAVLTRAHLKVSKTLRAAKRAEERWQATDEDEEVQTLEFQLDQLEYESDDGILQEFDIIRSRLHRLTEDFNRLAAKDANKDLEFACSICFDNNKMDALRILAPCGHGFCKECVATHMVAAAVGAAGAVDDDPDGPVCPTCRGAIASVMTAYF
jgi:hypothetical protein